MHLPSQIVSKKDVDKKWLHIANVPLDVSSDKIFILVGADLPEIHVSYGVITGGTNIPIAMLTKLGRALLRGKANNNNNILLLYHI